MTENVQSSLERFVLIVDDDAATRHLYPRALGRAGLSTLEACDGMAALELLKGWRVALVLLDGQMPGMSGLQVIARIREEARTAMLPVVMVTAAGELKAKVAGLEAGADDYLPKPVALDELVVRVRTQLRRSTAWQEVSLASHRKASLIESLARVARDASQAVTAASACSLLGEELGDVAIVAFGVRSSSVLSASGALASTMPPGSELDAQSATRLRELCERGPWAGPSDGRSLIGPFAHAACGVPLVVEGRILGSLLVATASRPSAQSEIGLLSSAAAVAPVLSLLLAPALDKWVSA